MRPLQAPRRHTCPPVHSYSTERRRFKDLRNDPKYSSLSGDTNKNSIRGARLVTHSKVKLGLACSAAPSNVQLKFASLPSNWPRRMCGPQPFGSCRPRNSPHGLPSIVDAIEYSNEGPSSIRRKTTEIKMGLL